MLALDLMFKHDAVTYLEYVEDADTFFTLFSLVITETPPAIIKLIAHAAAFVQNFRYIVSCSSQLKSLYYISYIFLTTTNISHLLRLVNTFFNNSVIIL